MFTQSQNTVLSFVTISFQCSKWRLFPHWRRTQCHLGYLIDKQKIWREWIHLFRCNRMMLRFKTIYTSVFHFQLLDALKNKLVANESFEQREWISGLTLENFRNFFFIKSEFYTTSWVLYQEPHHVFKYDIH
jgi:hypothetical protein